METAMHEEITPTPYKVEIRNGRKGVMLNLIRGNGIPVEKWVEFAENDDIDVEHDKDTDEEHEMAAHPEHTCTEDSTPKDKSVDWILTEGGFFGLVTIGILLGIVFTMLFFLPMVTILDDSKLAGEIKITFMVAKIKGLEEMIDAAFPVPQTERIGALETKIANEMLEEVHLTIQNHTHPMIKEVGMVYTTTMNNVRRLDWVYYTSLVYVVNAIDPLACLTMTPSLCTVIGAFFSSAVLVYIRFID